MKQIISLFIVMFSLTLSSFASNPEVGKPILNSFQQSFAGASEVAWTEGTNFTKATFQLHGKTVFAYYSEEGELMAVTRNIAVQELPAGLASSLKAETAGRWVSELFIVSRLGRTSYYAVLENADTKVVYVSKQNKKWSVYQTEEKQ